MDEFEELRQLYRARKPLEDKELKMFLDLWNSINAEDTRRKRCGG